MKDLMTNGCVAGTEFTEENAGRISKTVGRLDGENNSGDGQADLEIQKVDTLNGVSNEENSSQMDMRVNSPICSNITSLEKRNFSSVVESTDENLSVRAKFNGLQSHNEDTGNKEVDSAQRNSEAIEITYIDDSKRPMNMMSESQLDSKFIYSKGHGESGMTILAPVKELINESSHGTLEESGKTMMEIDVERVLEEQDTHDLYCPNCNSCITKRVILRKRKRIIGGVLSGTKRERAEPLLQPGLGESPAATDEPSHETQPDVFRCLSCFSIFIPTADGLRSFWIFRRNIEGKNLQSPQQTATRNLSWVSAIFETFRVKNTRNEPDVLGRETAELVQEDNLQTLAQFQNPSETQTDVTTDRVFLVQGGLMPGRSNANVMESVGSEIQNPSQETNQGLSEPGETQVADGNGVMQQAVDDHPKLKGQLQDLECKDEVLLMKAGLTEIFSFMDMKPGFNPEQKTLEDGMNPSYLQKPSVLSHGDANFDIGKVLKGVPEASISEGDNLQLVREDVNVEHVNPSLQNDENEFTVSEIPSATNDQNSTRKVLPTGGNSIITTIPGTSSPFDHSASLRYPSRSDNGLNRVTDDQDSVGKVPLVGGNSMTTSTLGVLLPNAVQINIKRLESVATPAGPEADSIQSVEEGIITTDGMVSSQNNQIVSSSPAPGTSTGQEMRINIDQQKVDTTARHEWDVLKSIVYGGLIESITSLIVVSSAAGSDTNTLNIVVLGLANLIGGLFVIAHNLRETKKGSVIGADESKERLDRYQETLGRRENFRRHVVAAVLSYIIFGLIPPAVYGFSFLRSDNKEYKLIAVAATSLVCIAFLAIGKAHVGKAPKAYVKTSLYYVCMGILASGLSYIAGQLLNQLLEKVGLSSPSAPAAPTSAFLESNSAKLTEWASSYYGPTAVGEFFSPT